MKGVLGTATFQLSANYRKNLRGLAILTLRKISLGLTFANYFTRWIENTADLGEWVKEPVFGAVLKTAI